MNMPVNHGEFNTLVNGEMKTTSRIIAEKFGKQHKDVLRAIRNLDCSDDFNERNFAPVEFIEKFPHKSERRVEYHMTRDGFTFLAMGFTGKEAAEWKEKFIAAFNAMEKRLRVPVIDVRDRSQLALITTQLIEMNQEQERQIASMQADVDAHERLSKADGSFAITDAAKALGVRPKELFDWLSQNGWIYKRAGSGSWLGYQTKTTIGYLEHKTTTVLRADGSEKITEQVRVTGKGLAKLAKLVPGAGKEVE